MWLEEQKLILTLENQLFGGEGASSCDKPEFHPRHVSQPLLSTPGGPGPRLWFSHQVIHLLHIAPHFPDRKPRLREVQSLVPGHTASLQQSQNLSLSPRS